MHKLPLNVWILAITFSLTMSGVALLVLVGGLIGNELAPSGKLSTLPMAIFVIGNALFTIPAALVGSRWGRKKAAYCGFTLSLCGALCASWAIQQHSFFLFCIASTLLGSGTAFYHQFRFAALESLADQNLAGPALSLLMLCAIGGSLLGPELGSLGRDWFSQSEYSASFLLFGLMVLVAMLVFSLFQNPVLSESKNQQNSRPLREIIRQPIFIIAVSSAALAYALMSFLMTSTPISMHVLDGHSLSHAKNVIQAHMIAMFLPSLFSGFLLQRIGASHLMLAGALCYAAVLIVGLSGQHVVHYWWALVLLGVGWNFLYISGTSLLSQTHQNAERFKVQALNDFLIFGLQALASLSAAWVLFGLGWRAQLWLGLIPTAVCLFMALWLRKHR